MKTDVKNKKMLIIHHCGSIGGAGLSLLHILRALKHLPLDVTVYCPNKPDDMIKEINKIGYECISEPAEIPIIEHFSGSDRFFMNFRNIRNIIDISKRKNEVEKLIKDVSPDIIAVNSMTLSYVGKIAKSNGIKSVCFHRETYAKGLFGIRTKYIKKSLSNDFDKVVFISNFDLEQSGHMENDSYVITDKVILNEYINDSHDINSKDNIIRMPENTVKVLYAGGMSSLKGAHIIISALAKCKSNVHLIFLQYDGVKRKKCLSDYSGVKNKLRYMLGKDYSAKILSLIEKYDLWNKVHFFPVTNKVEQYFNISDLVVFPSTSAHQARPIYEAGAASKPIIISESQNIAEFVSEGENGFLFKNGDINQLANLIDKLADNNDLRKSMGNNNYFKTIENHDFSKLKDELLDVFEF